MGRAKKSFGSLFVETWVSDPSGNSKIPKGANTHNHHVTVENGTTLPLDVYVTSVLPDYRSNLEFNSSRKNEWSDTVKSLLKRRTLTCLIKEVGGTQGTERVHVAKLETTDGLGVRTSYQGLPLEIDVEIA